MGKSPYNTRKRGVKEQKLEGQTEGPGTQIYIRMKTVHVSGRFTPVSRRCHIKVG